MTADVIPDFFPSPEGVRFVVMGMKVAPSLFGVPEIKCDLRA
jgi:hypothetical protein